jgi:deoxyribodipyrimidine photo-lyase
VEERVRKLNGAPVRPGGQYVLYWAQMNRRPHSNQALEYAVRIANTLNLPVLFYEGLTFAYPYASDRLHTFVLEGVADTAAALKRRGIGYRLYLRRTLGDANDVVYRLAADAAAVVTDDYPVFIASAHNARVPGRLDAAYFAVDASCVVPMDLFEKREYAARTIRPKIWKRLPSFLQPVREAKLVRRWTGASSTPEPVAEMVASCDVDRSVKPSRDIRGGSREALRRLNTFLKGKLHRYARDRNDPAKRATSNLSPYLHFGHISALDVALAVRRYAETHGIAADEFLEELIVRRELAFNFALREPRYDSFAALPDWARRTLRAHAADRREHVYSRAAFEAAATADPLWNAAQKELLLRGVIHGYYRMYWGKKVIEWSRLPEEALETMIYLHDRYALDGRDPNTYANILWCFGLHDRPWGERPVFGTVRYMSYEGMRRKTDVDGYLRQIRELELR